MADAQVKLPQGKATLNVDEKRARPVWSPEEHLEHVPQTLVCFPETTEHPQRVSAFDAGDHSRRVVGGGISQDIFEQIRGRLWVAVAQISGRQIQTIQVHVVPTLSFSQLVDTFVDLD